MGVETHASVDAIRDALRPHVYSPVPWTRTIEAMAADGVDNVIECGPGKILSGLIKRINRKVATHPIFDIASIDKALAAFEG